jgi:hypothetical protein
VLFLLLFVCSSGPVWANDGASPDAEAPNVEEVQDDSGTTPAPRDVASTRTDTGKKRSRRRVSDQEEVRFTQQYFRELMALLALCILWLLTRMYTHPEEVRVSKTRRTRQSAVSADEFARILFSILLDEDVDGYRSMYLNGAEAIRVMGQGAGEAYLTQRSSQVLETAFNLLYERIPPGARFEQGHHTARDEVEIWLLDEEDRRHCVPVGIIAHVGAVIRLVAPIVGPEGIPRIEDPSESE